MQGLEDIVQGLENIVQGLENILHMRSKSSLHSQRSIDCAEAFSRFGSKHVRKHPKVSHILEAFGWRLDM